MSQTPAFIERLSNDRLFGPGERARLRALAGRGLDESTPGFDLFTGLWWPLRKRNQAAPRREVAWLIAKLFAAFPLPHMAEERAGLPVILGRCEPRDDHDGPRFRRRFDALVCSPVAQLEPHLRWGLGEIAKAVAGRVPWAKGVAGLDWARLLDDLSLWDRGYNPEDTRQKGRLNIHEYLVHCHETHRDPQDLWACEYLYATNYQPQGASHAD